MKKIKYVLSLVGFIILMTGTSTAKKQIVPIVMDDIFSIASYNTSVDKLKIPDLEAEGKKAKLLVQCEEDITYFVVANRSILLSPEQIISSTGDLIVDEKGEKYSTTQYKRGHVDGKEPITITATFKDWSYGWFYGGYDWVLSKSCRSKNVLPKNKLKVPTFNGNSQGKLVIQCERDVVYYIMAYDCLKGDTNPSVTTNNGVAVTDEKKHVGEVWYVKGHVERKNTNSVKIMGHVYSGGKYLPVWTKTCP